MEIRTVIALCLLSFLTGGGLAAGAVYRDMALKLARLRKEGYILNPAVPDRPEQDEPWLDVPEG